MAMRMILTAGILSAALLLAVVEAATPHPNDVTPVVLIGE
jgi:hypothetical protein